MAVERVFFFFASDNENALCGRRQHDIRGVHARLSDTTGRVAFDLAQLSGTKERCTYGARLSPPAELAFSRAPGARGRGGLICVCRVHAPRLRWEPHARRPQFREQPLDERRAALLAWTRRAHRGARCRAAAAATTLRLPVAFRLVFFTMSTWPAIVRSR